MYTNRKKAPAQHVSQSSDSPVKSGAVQCSVSAVEPGGKQQVCYKTLLLKISLKEHCYLQSPRSIDARSSCVDRAGQSCVFHQRKKSGTNTHASDWSNFLH